MTAMSRQQAIYTALALPIYALAGLVWVVLYACHLLVSAVKSDCDDPHCEDRVYAAVECDGEWRRYCAEHGAVARRVYHPDAEGPEVLDA